MKRLIQEETDDRDETSSESEESINNIKEIKKIEEKKHYTETVELNGRKKEYKIDTGSPKTIKPTDENKLKLSGLHKINNIYQEVNKNEIKFPGKVPVDVEYENNKQKWNS